MPKIAKKPKKKAANGYQMPEPIPKGEVLTDINNKKWRLGPSIGKGGFGEIYSAQDVSQKGAKNYPYVVKIEPHENGPLFVEMHFYKKNAKSADIAGFKKKHNLKTFGMPAYLGSGSHEIESRKYRFIVMERFGDDIDKKRHENGGFFQPSVAYNLALQMTYVLEYIHEFGYVHADLKGANILMGMKPENKNQAYLVDFGLATKFSTAENFKPNPKKAHDGTIEYLSRDAHLGVPTRRGDLEILAYNLIHWLGGKLPWESCLKDVKLVQQKKEQAMDDVPKFVKNCFSNGNTNTDTIVTFLKYVNSLEFNEEPDYEKIRNLFKKEIDKNVGKKGQLEVSQETRKRRSSVEQVEVPIKKIKENEKREAKMVVKRGRLAKKVKEDVEEESREVMTQAMKNVLEKIKQKGQTKKKTEEKGGRNGVNTRPTRKKII